MNFVQGELSNMDLIFAVVLVIVACFLYVWFVKPELFIFAYVRIAARTSRATLKRLRDADVVTWSYLERGARDASRPSMLFINGFASRKEDWAAIIRKLPADQHVVAPDLPGHGSTDRVDLLHDPYSIFVKKLRQFVEAVGLDSAPFHIIGLSMGGATALCYSAAHTSSVCGATVICPAISTPTPSELKKRSLSGKRSPFADDTFEGHKQRIPFIANRTKHLPDQITNRIAQATLAANKPYEDFFTPLYERLNADNIRTQGIEAAEKVTCPSQVIWGQDDKMVHVSGAETLQERLPNLKALHIIPHCGHAVMLDAPQHVTDAILDFHRRIS